MSRWEKAKKKVETTTTLLRLVVVVGSAYMLYRKLNQGANLVDVMSEESAQRSANEVGSATRPLVAPTAETLPVSSRPSALAYGDASPDQSATAKALQTPVIAPLSPTQVAAAAIQSAGGWLQSALVSA